MKVRLLSLLALLASRQLTLLLLGLFLLLYAEIAFYAEEPLLTLMGMVRHNLWLKLLLALIPIGLLVRLVRETVQFLQRSRMLAGKTSGLPPSGFVDALEMTAVPHFKRLGTRLRDLGYTTRRSENSLFAWRGLPCFPPRSLFLLGGVLLFLGILLSLTTRTTMRQTLVEGEPLPQSVGPGRVAAINLQESPQGLLLSRTLSLDLELPGTEGDGKKRFGLYPPGRLNGAFVYPRTLLLAPLVQFSGPELPAQPETYYLLQLYPPGREDSIEFPGTPYRLVLSLAQSDAAGDPFSSGDFVLWYRLVRWEVPMFTGLLPVGGKIEEQGFQLALPDIRRAVMVDFIRDAGVPLIWSAVLLWTLSLACFLPIRFFAPRQEMWFSLAADNKLQARFHSEGQSRAHLSVFHESIDLLAEDS